MEEIPQKHQILQIPFSLDLSEKGELSLSGEIDSDNIQPILDASHLRYSLYLEHQKQLVRESNLTALYIGVIFSTVIGLAVFCLFNQSPRTNQSSIHSEVIKNEFTRFFVS